MKKSSCCCLYALGNVDPFDDLVVYPDPSVVKNEGENIILRCEASITAFREEPSWTKDKKTLKIEQGRMNVTKKTDKTLISELHIQNATLQDAGLYKCNAVKQIDGRDYQKSIRLTIESKSIKVTVYRK